MNPWVIVGFLVALIVVGAGCGYEGSQIGAHSQLVEDNKTIAQLQADKVMMKENSDTALQAANKMALDQEHQAQANQAAADAAYEKGKHDAEIADAPTIAGLKSGSIRLSVALTTATSALHSVQLCGSSPCAGLSQPGATGTLTGAVAANLDQYANADFNDLRRKLIEANAIMASDRATCGTKD
jgi:hypothetical protein